MWSISHIGKMMAIARTSYLSDTILSFTHITSFKYYHSAMQKVQFVSQVIDEKTEARHG